MIKFPSVQTLQRGLAVERDTAKQIRGILDGSRSPLLLSNHAAAYSAQCMGKPADYMLKLVAINEILGLHGVEYIPAGRGKRSPAFYYLNTGDSYAVTILRFGPNQYRVGSWGDQVERGNYE